MNVYIVTSSITKFKACTELFTASLMRKKKLIKKKKKKTETKKEQK